MSTLTSATQAKKLVATLRETFNSGKTTSRAWRTSQLRALRQMVSDNEQLFEQALHKDLGKSSTEAQLTEIGIILSDIDFALKNLSSWLKPQKVRVPLALQPAQAQLVSEPVGVVLIIAPWNYPMQLLLAPLVGALAAGNAAVVKPSELASATSKLLAKLIPVYLDTKAVAVVEGEAKQTGWLLEQHFDHIFYTGNGTVARIIAEAAAKNLTPITLELGGKSPLYIDDSVNIAAAAKRIAWAKFINAGQTCVAPDYVVGTKKVLAELEKELVRAVAELFSEKPSESNDYGRIINPRHFERLTNYLQDGKVVAAEEPQKSSQFIAPTILTGVKADAPIMQEEIFGPVLPMIVVKNDTEAIDLIRSKPQPLALYVFSENKSVRKAFTTRTSSGALVFNAAVIHLSVPGLPFGGVGESGMGSYRGKRSFDTFSHAKPVLSKSLTPETLSLVFPPYTPAKKKLIQGLLRKLSS